MADAEMGTLTERVSNIDSRLSSVHEQQKQLRTDYTNHERHCAQRSAIMELQMKGIMWMLRTIGGCVILLVLKALFEVMKVAT